MKKTSKDPSDEAELIADSIKKRSAGNMAGIVASFLGLIGIFSFAIIFTPIAAVVAIFGTITSITRKNFAGMGFNALAWVLILIGVFTSPVLLTLLGYANS